MTSAANCFAAELCAVMPIFCRSTGSKSRPDFLRAVVTKTIARPPAVGVHVSAVFASMLEIPSGSGGFALSVGVFPHYADAESHEACFCSAYCVTPLHLMVGPA